MNPTTAFTLLGRYIKAVDELDAIHATLDTRRDDIESAHSTASSLETVENLQNTYNSAHANIQSAIQGLITLAEGVITDYDLVVSNLNIPRGSGLDAVLRALYSDMVVDGYYVDSLSVNASFSDPAPTDVGQLVFIPTLDGATSPKNGVSAFLGWAGEETQLLNDGEVLIATCTADSYSNGTGIDNETYQLQSLHNSSAYSGFTEGTGLSAQIRPVLAENLIDSVTAGFTSFSSNVPSGWTVDSGTAGTDFDQETTDVFRNASALRVPTTGSGDLQLSTTIDASLITPSKAYVMGVFIRTDNSTVDDQITLTLKDGSTTIKQIDIDLTATTLDDWGDINSAIDVVNIPNTISSTELTIELAFTAFGANPEENIYVGTVFLAPVNYHAGLGVVLVPGATPGTIGDDLKLTLSSDLNPSKGRFQRFFHRAWDFQLPVSGSTILPDTLITS